MSSARPIPDGKYRIKLGTSHGVGGEYITGGVPGTILTVQPLHDGQEFDVSYDDDDKAYIFRQWSNPGHPGISYLSPEVGQILRIERARPFRIVQAAGEHVYKIFVAESNVGVSVDRSEVPALLTLGVVDIADWQFVRVDDAAEAQACE